MLLHTHTHRMSLFILAAVVLCVLASGLGKTFDDPYLQTFLRHDSYKTIAQIRSVGPKPPIVDARDDSCVPVALRSSLMLSSGVVMSVTPSALLDGQDAFVSFEGVPNPTSQDYLTVSCGPAADLNDFIDAVYVGPSAPGSITDVWVLVFVRGSITDE